MFSKAGVVVIVLFLVLSASVLYLGRHRVEIEIENAGVCPSGVHLPVEVTDDFGRNVTIYSSERIISLSPETTEILFAIGAGDRVVGVTEYCNYPPEAKKIEKIGTITSVNVEKVVSLQPDIVFGCELNGKETFEYLEDLNISVVGIHPENISEILDDIMMMGRATGTMDNATELVSDMRKRIEDIEKRTSGLNEADRPRVAHVCWHDPIWVAGSGCFMHEVIEKAGGKNVFSYLKGYKSVSLETFIDRNPEVIIVSVGHGGAGWASYNFMKTDERLKVVDAVKNNRVYPIDADIVSRASPRIVDGLEEIARDIHPELFEERAGYEEERNEL